MNRHLFAPLGAMLLLVPLWASPTLAAESSTPTKDTAQDTAETARKTNEVLSSVAGIARNLELADVPSPINIRADRMEFRYGQGVLRYDGNVSVDHAGASVQAKSLEISFEPEGRRSLKKITAFGDVEVIRGDDTVRAQLAEYDPVAGTIVLSQGARLGSGPNSLSGEKVVVYLSQRRAVVLGIAPAPKDESGKPTGAAPTGSGRIKAVFMPDSLDSKKPDGQKPNTPKKAAN